MHPKGLQVLSGSTIPLIADHDIREMVNFVTGANEKDAHLIQVNIGRDFQVSQFADIRRFSPGDPCPRCGGMTRTDKGIEVGHTFKLGTKYSKAMNATFTDEQGNEKEFVMGCYGIGVGRTVAAAIEQSYDQNGIIFPMPHCAFPGPSPSCQYQERAPPKQGRRALSEPARGGDRSPL